MIRIRCVSALLLVLFGMTARGDADTLVDELRREDPKNLVLQARERGEIVRGAILFHQGNIACAKCHRATSDQNRIGPDLGQLPNDTTDVSLVESILSPSKVIKPEFQTVKVLMQDGRVLRGVVAEKDDARIVLRDAQEVTSLIQLDRNEIDEIANDSISIMPDGLVDQLKGRQQFLDLLRYVIDLKERGSSSDAAVASISVARRSLSDSLRGHVLLRQHNCVACHASRASDQEWLTPSAPDLRWSAKRLNPKYLASFIASPHQSKPGTAMPQMMMQLTDAERLDAAAAIIAFLVSIETKAAFEDTKPETTLASIKRGQELFHSVGCVACHSPRDDQAFEQPIDDSIPLGELRGKYATQALIEFLEDPHQSRPNGRMPSLRLTHREATDVTNYLLQRAGEFSGPIHDLEIGSSPQQIELGRSLFTRFDCGRCHTGIIQADSSSSYTSMERMDLESGCLSSDVGSWPEFDLSPLERQQIRQALQPEQVERTADQSIDLSLAYFNCVACHDRNELGGVSQLRRGHFQTTNLNLGEQGRIPPTLSGVGAKLKSKWMRDVLVNGRAVRPYIKTRMPQYGEQNVGHLVELFQSVDELSETRHASFKNQKETRELGLKLVGNKGLNCVACHTYQYKTADTMPAVDLTEMAERLKKDWFYQYMLSPQSFSPNTVMPSFWPNGKSMRADIPGSPEDHVEAIWQYLLDGRQARAPRGVIREPLEIVVADEARMLRRSYPGIGKRGIGVGYPGGMNLAYDAEQMRLASVWKGRFVDPSGVWYGQGHGRVRPIGNPVQLANGPELDHMESPWAVDEGRPPEHRFRGYVLDEKRRPAFRYEFGDVTVEDDFTESEDNETKTLLRRIKLSASGRTGALRFRLLAGEGVQISGDSKQVRNERLAIRILSEHSATSVKDGGRAGAVIPLSFQPGDVVEFILEYQFD
ncbi:MAG: c-type cytochrome [Planctomycetota bacterium]